MYLVSVVSDEIIKLKTLKLLNNLQALLVAYGSLLGY